MKCRPTSTREWPAEWAGPGGRRRRSWAELSAARGLHHLLRRPTPQRIRVGGNVAGGKLVHQVLPDLSGNREDRARSGTVMLHAIIAKDGTIQELQYVSGPALLMRAAMDAVHSGVTSRPC